MKYLLTSILSFIILNAVSQEIDSMSYKNERSGSFKSGWVSSNGGLNLDVGLYKLQTNNVSDLVLSKTGVNFGNYLINYGSSLAFSRVSIFNKDFSFDSHYDINFYNSINPITVDSEDSIRYSLSGFNFGFDNCKDLLPNKDRIDLLIGLGFNLGWVNFRKWDLNDTNKENRRNMLLNPYFSPKIVADFRLYIFKRLSISLRPEIQFDITNSKWYSINKNTDSIGGFKATGHGLKISIGVNSGD